VKENNMPDKKPVVTTTEKALCIYDYVISKKEIIGISCIWRKDVESYNEKFWYFIYTKSNTIEIPQYITTMRAFKNVNAEFAKEPEQQWEEFRAVYNEVRSEILKIMEDL
jgi:hypothetical protein